MKTLKGFFTKEKKKEIEATVGHSDGNTLFAGPKTRYQCPMKCEGKITYNEPGDCPVCNMRLMPVNKTNSSTDQHHCC